MNALYIAGMIACFGGGWNIREAPLVGIPLAILGLVLVVYSQR